MVLMSLRDFFSTFFHTASAFGTGNENHAGGILLSGLVFPITGWMQHIMRPTRGDCV
jgi:hypothetical protein